VARIRDAIDAHIWAINGLLAVSLLTLAVRGAGFVDNEGAALGIAVAVVATVFSEIGTERERRRGAAAKREAETAAADEAELVRAHALGVARNVREVILATRIYTDTDEYLAQRDEQFASSDPEISLTDWSVNGILARGEQTLDDAKLGRLAEGLEYLVGHARNLIGPEANLLDVDMNRALIAAFKGGDRAVDAARWARDARVKLEDRRDGATVEERRRLEDRCREARSFLFGALQVLEGGIEVLERTAGPSLAELYDAEHGVS
jgi:hypothetical protein